MELYYVTLSQGRSDNVYLEADNKSDILTLLGAMSTAIVSSIKQIVYSKEYGINYVPTLFQQSAFFSKVLVLASSKTKAKTLTFYHFKKSYDKAILLNDIQKLYIDDEPIQDIINILEFE